MTMDYSRELKALRLQAGLTIRQLAALLKMPQSSYSNFENRYRDKPFTAQFLENLGQVLRKFGVKLQDVRRLAEPVGYRGSAQGLWRSNVKLEQSFEELRQYMIECKFSASVPARGATKRSDEHREFIVEPSVDKQPAATYRVSKGAQQGAEAPPTSPQDLAETFSEMFGYDADTARDIAHFLLMLRFPKGTTKTTVSATVKTSRHPSNSSKTESRKKKEPATKQRRIRRSKKPD
jgi:transcriptional regulator with XRE-family HTH domain